MDKEKYIIGKAIVKAMNHYFRDESGDVCSDEYEQFKKDLKTSYEMIKKFAEHYNVM